ncbi:MAG: pyrroline-5-carboxylate reductase [SAR324 cluster bacterium]|nr:pyrroline-5-carboxylate reductase [SAR324 cluster bacterium]MBL7035250.1 pyrroline-5-carboxylate reductase [SAR324 cluster bacterium]
MRLIIVGGGNMGGAILLALVNTKALPAENILLIESDQKKRNKLSSATGCKSQAEFNENVRSYDVLLLAVKPQGATPAMELLAQWIMPKQLVVSVMAGISLQTMYKALRQKKLVRVMPNIPTLITEGMSVFFASEEVDTKGRDWIMTLFSSCGTCLEAKDENAIDAATAISGSGPGYLFYFAEQMTNSAKALGFSDNDAQLLVQKTIRGATLLWESQQVSPETLRLQVSSPGGTTLAALNHFHANKVGASIQAGIREAYQRAKELSS